MDSARSTRSSGSRLARSICHVDAFHARRELLEGWLGVDHDGGQTLEAEQLGEATQVTGIGVQVTGGKGMAERMRVDRLQATLEGILFEQSNHGATMAQLPARSHPERRRWVVFVGM